MTNVLIFALICVVIIAIAQIMKKYEIKIDKETDRINKDPKSYVNGIVPEIYK